MSLLPWQTEKLLFQAFPYLYNTNCAVLSGCQAVLESAAA